MKNKYDRFFKSVQDFVLKTNLASPEDLQGSTLGRINYIEEKLEVIFPDSLRSFLMFFGEKCRIEHTDFTLEFTDDHIWDAKENAKRLALFEDMNEWKEVKNILKGEMTCLLFELDMEQILLLRFDFDRRNVHFIECIDENPLLQFVRYGYKDHREVLVDLADIEAYYPGEWSVVGWFRLLLFDAIYRKLTRYGEVLEGIFEEFNNIDSLDWVKCHLEHRRRNTSSFFDFIPEERRTFSRKADAQAQETGIVMTIDEFEWAFIEHLRGLGVDI